MKRLSLDLAYMRQRPPKSLIEKLKKSLYSINEYPSGDYAKLKGEIAKYAGVKIENVFVGNGSDEVIDLITRAFGKKVLIPIPTFSQFEAAAKRCGNVPKLVNCMHGASYKLKFADNDLKKATLTWVCNPNNPTGSRTTQREIMDVLQKTGGIVAVDECLFEYMGETSIPLLRKYRNMIITRSLSKAFGIAGLRLGYAIADKELIEALEGIRQPFNVNAVSEAAGLIIFDHLPYFKHAVEETKKIRDSFCNALDESGIGYMKPETPFVFVNFGSMDNAKKAFKKLRNAGINTFPAWDSEFTASVKMPFIRFSIGSKDEMDYVIRIIRG